MFLFNEKFTLRRISIIHRLRFAGKVLAEKRRSTIIRDENV